MTTLPDTQHSAQAEINGPGGQFRVVLEPFSPGVLSVAFERLGRYLPEVDGLTLGEAALAWARAGFYVLPVKPSTKLPGSLVGNGWPDKSSCDVKQITRWWAKWPDAGIAVHTGASGVVALDLDVDEIPDELEPLRLGAIHLTRANSASSRGHYIFATTETFVSGALRLADGTKVGEVRSGNTVVIVAPTPHSKGGNYRVVKESIPALPNEVRALLRCSAKAVGGDAATAQQITSFAAQHTQNSRPKALEAILKTYRQKLDAGADGTRNPTFAALCWAAREARLGFFPWSDALAQIEVLARDDYRKRGKQFDARDFREMTRYAISEALATDLTKIEEKQKRDFGTDTRQTSNNFKNWNGYTKMNTVKAETNGHALEQSSEKAWTITAATNDDADDWDTTDESYYPTEPSEFEIAKHIRRNKEQKEAQRRLNLSAWEPPPDQGTALEQFVNRGPEPQWLLDGLIMPGSRLLINAQYKTGKTTLGINLVRSLVTGSSFLRKFSMPGEPLQSVAYWNHEVTQRQFVGWLDDAGLVKPDEPYGKRIHLLNTRDFSVPISFENEAVVDWTIEWLKSRKVQFWLIDTLSRLYTGSEKENDEITAWWAKLDEIAARAGVGNIAIFHHTGYSDEAAERGRGASALMGLPDVLVSYRHNGKPGQFAPDNVRWFKAFGRSVDVPEFELSYNDSMRELYATGTKNTRQEPDLHMDAVNVWQLVSSIDEPINKTALCKKLALGMTGRDAARTNRILAYAEEMQWVERKAGKRNEVLFCAGESLPAHLV